MKQSIDLLRRKCDELEAQLDLAERAYANVPSEANLERCLRLRIKCDRAWDKFSEEELK